MSKAAAQKKNVVLPVDSWASSIGVRRSMQGNRSRDTSPEWAVRRLLHGAGMRYRVNIRPVPSIPRKADIVFPRQRVAVFIDGCFWHACPEHFVAPKSNVDYWEGKIRRNRSRDLEATSRLTSAGWVVLRFWAHDSAEDCAARIAELVDERRTAATTPGAVTPLLHTS